VLGQNIDIASCMLLIYLLNIYIDIFKVINKYLYIVLPNIQMQHRSYQMHVLHMCIPSFTYLWSIVLE